MSVVKKYKKRAFLNDDRSMTGIVSLNMELFKSINDKTKKSTFEIYGTLSISDCSRMIYLELQAENPKTLRQLKKKIARLKSIVEDADKFIKENEKLIIQK